MPEYSEHAYLKMETHEIANLETVMKLTSVVEKAKLKIVNLYNQAPSKMRDYRLQIADAEWNMAREELAHFKKVAKVEKTLDELMADAFCQPHLEDAQPQRDANRTS